MNNKGVTTFRHVLFILGTNSRFENDEATTREMNESNQKKVSTTPLLTVSPR